MAATNEICCNRRTMSSSYHFLGTQDTLSSSLLASIWSFMPEFWPREHEEQGVRALMDMAPNRPAWSYVFSLFTHWPAGWQHAVGNSKVVLGAQTEPQEGRILNPWVTIGSRTAQVRPSTWQLPWITCTNIAINVPTDFEIPKLCRNVGRVWCFNPINESCNSLSTSYGPDTS